MFLFLLEKEIMVCFFFKTKTGYDVVENTSLDSHADIKGLGASAGHVAHYFPSSHMIIIILFFMPNSNSPDSKVGALLPNYKGGKIGKGHHTCDKAWAMTGNNQSF